MSTVTQSADLAGTAAGIADIYLFTVLESTNSSPIILYLASSYYAICLAFNLLVTLMITVKLILHRKNLQHAVGTSNAATRVYTTVVIMLVESYALYAIALISVVATWSLLSVGLPITTKILGTVQVCAVFRSPDAQAWNDIPPHRSLLHILSFSGLPSGER